MATYTRSAAPRMRAPALFARGFACGALAVVAFEGWSLDEGFWLHRASPILIVYAAVAAFVVWVAVTAEGRTTTTYAIEPERIVITSSTGMERRLARSEVVGYFEDAKGLTLRLHDNPSWPRIPRDVDGYEACRAEIAAGGVPELIEDQRVNVRRVRLARLCVLVMAVTLPVIVASSDPLVSLVGAALLIGAFAGWDLHARLAPSQSRVLRASRLALFVIPTVEFALAAVHASGELRLAVMLLWFACWAAVLGRSGDERRGIVRLFGGSR